MSSVSLEKSDFLLAIMGVAQRHPHHSVALLATSEEMWDEIQKKAIKRTPPASVSQPAQQPFYGFHPAFMQQQQQYYQPQPLVQQQPVMQEPTSEPIAVVKKAVPKANKRKLPLTTVFIRCTERINIPSNQLLNTTLFVTDRKPTLQLLKESAMVVVLSDSVKEYIYGVEQVRGKCPLWRTIWVGTPPPELKTFLSEHRNQLIIIDYVEPSKLAGKQVAELLDHCHPAIAAKEFRRRKSIQNIASKPSQSLSKVITGRIEKKTIQQKPSSAKNLEKNGADGETGDGEDGEQEVEHIMTVKYGNFPHLLSKSYAEIDAGLPDPREHQVEDDKDDDGQEKEDSGRLQIENQETDESQETGNVTEENN